MYEGKEKLARDVVQAIVEDICGRRGFRQAWEECDFAVAKEIRETWAAMVLKALLMTGDKTP